MIDESSRHAGVVSPDVGSSRMRDTARMRKIGDDEVVLYVAGTVVGYCHDRNAGEALNGSAHRLGNE